MTTPMSTTTTTAATATGTTWTTTNKVGLGLLVANAVTNIPSALFPTPDGETGPPLAILIACSVLGVIGTVAGVVAWVRRSRSAARLAAVAITLAMITSLPALFVDVPAGIKAIVAVGVVWTIAAIVLTFAGGRRRA